jgi:4-cresol dehydrogenase (hydroxylating) flavoprotein subunit
MTKSRQEHGKTLAIEAFVTSLRSAGIDVSTDGLEAVAQATFSWTGRPLAVAHPATRDEAALALAIAGRSGCPVHPFSRGRNWGLGSRLPVRHAAMIDLSRLNRIIDLDDTGGSACVEPGVTFEQLQDALAERGLRHHVPGFGGPVTASVLGNALERGEGTGNAGDRFGGLFDLEVALSTGERFHTGFSRFGDMAVGPLHGRPAGPLTDALFSQSGLGLVLSGRVSLNHTAHWNRSTLIEFSGPEQLATAMPALQAILRGGICNPHDIALWNGAKRISSLVTGRAALAAAIDGPDFRWGVAVIIAADHQEILDAKTDVLKAAFKSCSASIRTADDRDESGQRIPTHLTGFSHGGNVASAYAAKATMREMPLDPDRDRCGFVWLCPVLPFDAVAVLRVDGLIAKATANTAIFGALGMQAVSARALHAYVSLAWDRDDEAADRQAGAVHDILAEAFQAWGYGAFRLAHPTISRVAESPVYSTVVARLALALDPSGVMSPGKYPGR